MAACVAYLIIGIAASSSYADGLATFENFTEGPIGDTFLDPLSSIFFQNAFLSQQSIPAPFIADQAVAFPSLPVTTPGTLLTAGGYVPGAGLNLTPYFGFTATLPESAGDLRMTLAFNVLQSPASLELSILDSQHALLETRTFPLAGDAISEAMIALTRQTADIGAFTVRVHGASAAFDNISFAVPEPVSATLVLGVATLASRDRRRVVSVVAG